MANDYYTAPSDKVPLTTIRASVRNDDAAAVEAGFDTLPSELDVKRSQYGSDDSSSAALYEITIPNLAVPYYEGLEITFQAAFENTGVANISINGQTNLKIVNTAGDDILTGSIKAFQAVTVIYVTAPAANFQLISTAATTQDIQDASAAAAASEASAVAAAASAAEADLSADRAEMSASLSIWDASVTYNKPIIVAGSDNEYYQTLIDGNTNNDPASTTGFWQRIDFVRNDITNSSVQHFYRNR